MSSTKEKIRGFANKRSLTLNDWGDDGFWIVEGSTIVYITFPIVNDSTREDIVSITSAVVRNVRVDSTLQTSLPPIQ